MEVGGIVLAALDAAARETMLFAGVGFLIGGLDDLAVDLVFLLVWTRRRLSPVSVGDGDGTLAEYPARAVPRRFAIFVPAWDEAAVIGKMLRTMLARFGAGDYRVYVGTYPNDRATIDAVAAVADQDARVRVVTGGIAGPTTKADCLNTLWHALRVEADGWDADAIVLHDAEDVVDRHELRIYDALLDRYAVVQLPVLPLIDRRARLVSGHYADEFSEAHTKNLIVRQALGAGLPLAGVGCAIARDALAAVAVARGGDPFDGGSLTEDYELGLLLSQRGATGVVARIRAGAGTPLVAVRAYFPATLDTAVRQKTRWMIGIALAGWDRLGWGQARRWSERWMRMRDRRAPLAMLVLGMAYIALLGWGAANIAHGLMGTPMPDVGIATAVLLRINAAVLLWRIVARMAFTTRDYGWREGLWSLPRMLVGNLIALLAVRRALWRYVAMLRGARMRWDKTTHVFPDDTAIES